MRLNEHAIDLFEVDDAGLVANGFNQGAEAKIARAAQESLAGANDQGQRFLGKGVMAQTGAIQLAQDELFGGLRTDPRQKRRISDAGADFLVHGQSQRLQQRGLAQEHEVVGTGKVLAKC